MEPQFKSAKAQRDYTLVCRARDQHDQDAFAQLMQYYRQSVYLLTLKMTSDSVAAEDLVIDTFDKAFSQIARYTPTAAFSTWLFRVATNVCIDYLRAKRIATVPLSSLQRTSSDEPVELPFSNNSPSPEETIILQQRNEQIANIIKQLPLQYRSVIELRFYDDLTYEEIAEKLQLPLNTVRVHILRAKKLLATILTNNNIER